MDTRFSDRTGLKFSNLVHLATIWTSGVHFGYQIRFEISDIKVLDSEKFRIRQNFRSRRIGYPKTKNENVKGSVYKNKFWIGLSYISDENGYTSGRITEKYWKFFMFRIFSDIRKQKFSICICSDSKYTKTKKVDRISEKPDQIFMNTPNLDQFVIYNFKN